MFDKKIFVTNVPFLKDSRKPLPHPASVLQPKSAEHDKRFSPMRCSLKQKSIFQVSNLKGLLNEL